MLTAAVTHGERAGVSVVISFRILLGRKPVYVCGRKLQYILADILYKPSNFDGLQCSITAGGILQSPGDNLLHCTDSTWRGADVSTLDYAFLTQVHNIIPMQDTQLKSQIHGKK